MNEKARLRQDIKIHGKDFIAADFKMHPHVYCYLREMESNGEIKCVGYESRLGRKARIYRIVEIREYIEDTPKLFKKPVKTFALWASIYPDVFTMPDFSGYQFRIRKWSRQRLGSFAELSSRDAKPKSPGAIWGFSFWEKVMQGRGELMRELTYLIYIVLWEGMIFGGTGYAVFVLDRSGWWFALAILISGMAYGPLKWIHGKST